MSKNDKNQNPNPVTDKTGTDPGHNIPDLGEIHRSWEFELDAMAETIRNESTDWDSMFGQLEQSVTNEPKRSRLYNLPTATKYTLLFFLALFPIAMILTFKLRIDFGHYPPLRMSALLSTFTVLLIFHTWILLRPLHKVALPTWFTHIALPGLGFALPVILALIPSPYHPALYTPTTQAVFTKDIVRCLVVGTILASPFLYTTHLFARFKPEYTFVGTSAAAGGLLANIGLQLLCPKESAIHLLLSHATISVLLLGLLWLISKRPRSKQQ